MELLQLRIHPKRLNVWKGQKVYIDYYTFPFVCETFLSFFALSFDSFFHICITLDDPLATKRTHHTHQTRNIFGSLHKHRTRSKKELTKENVDKDGSLLRHPNGSKMDLRKKANHCLLCFSHSGSTVFKDILFCWKGRQNCEHKLTIALLSRELSDQPN